MRNPLPAKASRGVLLPAVIFLVALGLTAAVVNRKRQEADPSATGRIVDRHSGREAGTGQAADLEKEVRRCLRNGDADAAAAALKELAEADPQAFFTLLGGLPMDLFKGELAETVKAAGARLPWGDAKVLASLNAMSSPGWRKVAWEAYLRPRVGKEPDAEVYDAVKKAQGTPPDCGLMEAALKKHPVEYTKLLAERRDQEGLLFSFATLWHANPGKMEDSARTAIEAVVGPGMWRMLQSSRIAADRTADRLATVYQDTGVKMGSAQGLTWAMNLYTGAGAE